MLANLKQFFYNPVCLNCGSFFVEDHLYCEVCFNTKIEHHLDVRIQQLQPSQMHAYLINWVPGESDLISEMVYRFKSNRCIRAWSYYAKFFASALAEQIDISEYHALVPLPGSKKSSIHSEIFAKYLSKQWGLPVLNSLYKSKTATQQKLKSASERHLTLSEMTICRLEQFTSEDCSNLNLIYVDDIMTTGATFRSSQIALENKNKSILVTLFCRPKRHQT